jgi:hypothetical protein
VAQAGRPHGIPAGLIWVAVAIAALAGIIGLASATMTGPAPPEPGAVQWACVTR